MSIRPPDPKAERSIVRFFQNNWLFISSTLLLLACSTMLLMSREQGDMLIAINKLRTPFWDAFFKIGTHFAEPIRQRASLRVF